MNPSTPSRYSLQSTDPKSMTSDNVDSWLSTLTSLQPPSSSPPAMAMYAVGALATSALCERPRTPSQRAFSRPLLPLSSPPPAATLPLFPLSQSQAHSHVAYSQSSPPYTPTPLRTGGRVLLAGPSTPEEAAINVGDWVHDSPTTTNTNTNTPSRDRDRERNAPRDAAAAAAALATTPVRWSRTKLAAGPELGAEAVVQREVIESPFPPLRSSTHNTPRHSRAFRQSSKTTVRVQVSSVVFPSGSPSDRMSPTIDPKCLPGPFAAGTSDAFSEDVCHRHSTDSDSDESFEFGSPSPAKRNFPTKEDVDAGLTHKRQRLLGPTLPPPNVPFGPGPAIGWGKTATSITSRPPLLRPRAPNGGELAALRLYTSAQPAQAPPSAQGPRSYERTREEELPASTPMPPSEFIDNADLPVFSDDTADWENDVGQRAASPLGSADLHGFAEDVVEGGGAGVGHVGHQAEVSAFATPQAAPPREAKGTGHFKVTLRRPKLVGCPPPTPVPQQQQQHVKAATSTKALRAEESNSRLTPAASAVNPEDASSVAQILVALRSSPATKLTPRSYRAERRRQQLPAAVRPEVLEPVVAADPASPGCASVPSPAPSSPLSEPESLGDDSDVEYELLAGAGAKVEVGPSDGPSTAVEMPASGSLRTLPRKFEIRYGDFPGFYERYHVPSQLPEDLRDTIFPANGPSLSPALCAVAKRCTTLVKGEANHVSDPFDLYKPRYTRGCGLKKEGLCPLCFDAGALAWFKTKISAYNYHMQVQHGISHANGRPLLPPLQFREVGVPRKSSKKSIGAHERATMLQGRCHACERWIDLQSVKDVDVKVPEIYFRKHAAKCHKRDAAYSDEGVFVQDEFFKLVSEAVARGA